MRPNDAVTLYVPTYGVCDFTPGDYDSVLTRHLPCSVVDLRRYIAGRTGVLTDTVVTVFHLLAIIADFDRPVSGYDY
jgi:hypothetical protein